MIKWVVFFYWLILLQNCLEISIDSDFQSNVNSLWLLENLNISNDIAQYFDSKHNVILRKVHKNIIIYNIWPE